MKQLVEKIPHIGATDAFFLFWIIISWTAVILTMAGWFNKFALLAIAILAGTILLLRLVSNGVPFSFKSKNYILLGVIAISIIFSSFFVAPTIFSGRDQGSLSEAAIRLSQNHHLNFSSDASMAFFKIYGPGKALNFPGFNYSQTGDLVTQFPIGYISWLATFYSWFGMNGLIIANSVSLFIFLIAFFSIADLLLKPNRSWMIVGFVLTSCVFIWIHKITLGENLALAVLWIAVYEIMKFYKQERRINFFIAIGAMGLLLFIRVEAITFWIMLIALLLYIRKKGMITRVNIFFKSFYVATSIVALIFLINLWQYRLAYVQFAKSIIKPLISGSEHLMQESIFTNWLYFVMILLSYSLLSFIIFGILGIFYSMRKKNLYVLIPFIIVAPTFFYLLFPNISLDHPWMLRRYVFSVVPAVILYTLIFFDIHLKRDWQFYFLTSLLLISNLVISVPFITFVPYRGLRQEITSIGANFQPDDLILVDQMSSGDNWSMMSGSMNFLGNLQSVYLINIDDIKKIDKSKFNRIFLVIPDEKADYYFQSQIGKQMLPIKDYQLNYPMISNNGPNLNSRDYPSVTFPQKSNVVVYGKIYQLISKI